MSLSRCTETAEIPLPDLPSDSEYWTKVSYSVGYNYTSRYLQGYWQKASKWIKFSTIQHITWRTHKKLSYKVWLKAEGTYLKTLWWWERDWVYIRDCLQAVWLISLITSVKRILKNIELYKCMCKPDTYEVPVGHQCPVQLWLSWSPHP